MWTIYALKVSYDAYVKVVELASCREGAMYKLQYNPEYWTFSVNPKYLYACNVVCYPEYLEDAKATFLRQQATEGAGIVSTYSFYAPTTKEAMISGTQYTAVIRPDNDPQLAASKPAAWYLEEVTTLPVKITSAGYSTFCCPQQATIPSGVTAAKETSVTIGGATAKISLTTLSGSIPAGTPVILKGNAGTYLFNISGTVADAPTGNYLRGTYHTIPKVKVPDSHSGEDIYVLMKGKVNGVATIGFFRDYIGNLAGFKAYLHNISAQTVSETKAIIFSFDGATQAPIVLTDDDDASDPFFSTSGLYEGTDRKALKQGMHITRGKKFVK